MQIILKEVPQVTHHSLTLLKFSCFTETLALENYRVRYLLLRKGPTLNNLYIAGVNKVISNLLLVELTKLTVDCGRINRYWASQYQPQNI